MRHLTRIDWRPFALWLLLGSHQASHSQLPYCLGEGNGGFSIDVDTVATNIGPSVNALGETTDLTGFNTYRLFVSCESQADLLQAVFGDSNYPSDLTTTTSFFQSPIGGPTESTYNPLLLPLFPSLEYDSFLSIGLTAPANAALGEQATQMVEDPESLPITESFEDGANLIMNSPDGSSWFVADAELSTNCQAGSDSRVFFAQVTTDGVLGGNLHFQLYRNGLQESETCINPYLSIPNYFNGGCMDEEACNFNESATFDDGSCDYCSCAEPSLLLTSSFPNALFPQYSIEVDIVANHDTTGITTSILGTPNPLEGMKTYRVYAKVDHPETRVLSGYGNDDEVLNISSTASFFQSALGGTTPSNISPFLYGVSPYEDLEYDSWVTIGIDRSPAFLPTGYTTVVTAEDPAYNWLTDFETGNALTANTNVGLAWLVTTPFSANVFPDSNLRVLIGQFTTSGTITGTLGLQIMPYYTGIGEDYRLPFSFTTEGLGEYVDVPNPLCPCDTIADADGDGVCDDVDPCIGVYDYCGVCNGPGPIYDCGCFDIPDGACDCAGNVLDILGVCGGGCESDVDGDGVCDTDEILGCTDPEACNFSVLHTEEDGSCLYLDALGVCGGDCEADVDGNGLCDTQDALHCGAGTHWDPELGQCIISCPSDVNVDGAVAVGDLLDLLADFGYFCSELD